MTLNRLLSATALSLLVAGCATTDPAPKIAAPKVTADAPSPKVETADLPVTVEAPAPVVTRPAPVYVPQTAPVAVAAPSIDLGSLDGTPAPTYEAAAPSYTTAVQTRGTMAPIYDDPADGGPLRRGAPSIAARKAAYRPGAGSDVAPPTIRNAFTPEFGSKLARAAKARLNPNVLYDARYVKIGYPWGDVPEHTGVCTDVVIRSYRALNVDLQSLVHTDMRGAFSAYPSRRIYGLLEADSNIDHRRVVNLEAFFERAGASVPATMNPEDYLPGDIVTWRLSGNEPHIGVISENRDPRTGNPLVIHNLGAGVREEDMLFLSPPVGHYRFAPDRDTQMAALAR